MRIGNAAVNQRQLDVYGEVIDALSLGRATGIAVDRHAWSLQRALLLFLEKHWDEPDEGIWEVRGPRQHFVHSKVMAWVAFDRAVTAVKNGMSGPAGRWQAIRDQIHREVCEKGYDAERGAFMQYYGSSQLDAAVLLIPEVGFLPPDDPRVVSTVRAVQRELMSDGLVRRYQLTATGSGQPGPDGLPGSEGAFLACSFWLANALQMIGQDDEATELFERLLSLRNDLGLLSEEYDPRYGRQVGNTPQAFSHVPLIQAALNLDRHPGAHSRTADADPPTVAAARRTVTAAPRPAADPGDYQDPGDASAWPGAVGAAPAHPRRQRAESTPAGLRYRCSVLRHRSAGPGAEAFRRVPLHAGPALGHPGGAGLRPAAVDLPGEAGGGGHGAAGRLRAGLAGHRRLLPGLHPAVP